MGSRRDGSTRGAPRRATGARAGRSGAGRKTAHKKHTKGLFLVGLFKLSKAVFFTAVGLGALHLVHKNVGGIVASTLEALRIDPERRVVGMLVEKAGLISNRELRRAGVLSILYAAVCVVEGTGLVMEKAWAEYFTVILTSIGLPWEIYELIERYSAYKVLLLAVNVAVLIYLIWILRKKRKG